ncbi:protein translocase subunit SecF [Corynebacterium epidermidicanis]|uniref:Protein-export membrane protein SecF n=1 Tax=Corynebacterium epidermidicanis TaxID=1050174 RepID=A0A0G3GUS3_9CORY|nr:protein translocase subunit SecF [Corynebacterium epidermidicanis]AKK03273.1 protein-export membrane protein SecF [Corynebacterium epidermidicanis]
MAQSTMNRLYTGEGGIDFIGRTKLWYSITIALLVGSILVIALRGFTMGIDFEGGTKMNMPAANLTTEQVEEAFTEATNVSPQLVQIVGAGDTRTLEIHTPRLSDEQIATARNALYEKFTPADATGKPTPDAIGDSTVSESWGSTITNRMIISMLVFFGLVFIYIMFRFERDMAVAAIAALVVDIVVISGTYSLVGFEVTPATIIGLLTVLSFSLYDTVVVFDKVKENTAGYEASTRRTYAEQANLAVNQTVMRSISTTVISALPILALMVVAVWMMGVGTLKDLALVQLIGIIEGAFSSVLLATPLLVTFKRRQKKVRAHDAAVAAARAGTPDATVAVAPIDGVSPAKRVVTTPVVPAKPVDTSGGLDKTGNGRTWRPNQGS